MSTNRTPSAFPGCPQRQSGLPLLLALLLSLPSLAADWPTYQHDARRSGASDETLDVSRLRLAWTWRSPQPPQSAWSGPARWDAYAGLRDLPSMRNYDLAFHAVAVGDAVYFGSSADDTVRCLDAETGREIWSFMTDGPVRLAPTWWAEKLYFGSDDGFVYCLQAADGQLQWKFQPALPRPKVLHNGRFISLAPCRTGVLVADGTAYFAHALLPWEPSYLSAVDAETGRAEGPGRYLRQLDGMTLEGTPAATSDLLVYPQGRVAPQLFRRADGQDQGQVKKSSGGSIVVVSLDASIFHGPGADSRHGDIRRSDPRSLEMIASHGRGNALVCAGQNTYMLTDDALVASDLVQGSVCWSVPSDFPHALIAADNVLYAGGQDEVGAFAAEDGKLLWRHPVQGNAFGLAVAHGRLLVSTDEGVIHAFCDATALQSEASEPIGAPTTTPDAPTGDAPTGDAQPDGTQAEIPVVDLAHLIGRWVFQTPAVRGEKVLDLAGTVPGRLLAPVRLERSGAYHDDNEYHRLSGRIHEVRVYEAALTSEQIAAHAAATADRFPAASPAREPLRPAAGPWLQFVAPGEALVPEITIDGT
jgi:outer membrane protein assembly factor BamB